MSKIWNHFIEEVCEDFISSEDNLNYVFEKLGSINDILRAKLIDQIQEYETSDNKTGGKLSPMLFLILILDDPNDLLIRSHSKLFKAIWNKV